MPSRPVFTTHGCKHLNFRLEVDKFPDDTSLHAASSTHAMHACIGMQPTCGYGKLPKHAACLEDPLYLVLIPCRCFLSAQQPCRRVLIKSCRPCAGTAAPDSIRWLYNSEAETDHGLQALPQPLGWAVGSPPLASRSLC